MQTFERCTKPQMPSSAKPRLHHYFPQFHLAYFADDERKLWCFDKACRLDPNPKRIPPASLAAEARLYDDDAPEASLEGVEEWLADTVDGPASTALRKVVAKQDVTRVEREDLGRYVMARDLRTPATRDFVLKTAQDGLETEYDARTADTAALRAAILEDSGVELSDEDIRTLAAEYRPVITKGFWLDFLRTQTVKALPRLLAKGWTLIHADEGNEFLTSDVGILKYHGAWDRPRASTPGWWTNADGWLMPLTPRLILAMAPGLLPQEKLAQREFVDLFNRHVVRFAREFVFSHSDRELRRAITAL